ncbi:MAG: hypothetical protein HYX47_07025 [Burkholderiales bacterium]|nr:hypothetical protein [Burkholderiales bacterium]
MQRRSLLKLGAVSAAVLAIAGGGLALMQPGLDAGRLAPASREVFSAVGRAILEGTLPADDGARQIALNGLLERIDTLVAGLPAHAQGELSQLLALLASGAGRRTMAGLAPEWSAAATPEVQQALQGMRVSGLALRRQAYQALHDIVVGAYFADASTWAQLGYPGPTKI